MTEYLDDVWISIKREELDAMEQQLLRLVKLLEVGGDMIGGLLENYDRHYGKYGRFGTDNERRKQIDAYIEEVERITGKEVR